MSGIEAIIFAGIIVGFLCAGVFLGFVFGIISDFDFGGQAALIAVIAFLVVEAAGALAAYSYSQATAAN